MNDDANLIDDDIRSITRNADVSLNAHEDVDFSVNIEIIKYKKVGSYRGVVTNDYITVGRNSYQRVENSK